MLKTVQEGFEVENREIRRQDYQETRLRKGSEIDAQRFSEIVNAIAITPSQRERFFQGGNSLLAAFKVLDEGKTYLLGVVVDKTGVMRRDGTIKIGQEKVVLPPIRNVTLGNPSITHYDVKYAIPDWKSTKAICDAVKKMPDFKAGVMGGRPLAGGIRLEGEEEGWGGELDGIGETTRLHLKLGKHLNRFGLTSETKRGGNKAVVGYKATLLGKLLSIGIEVPLKEPIITEKGVREDKEVLVLMDRNIHERIWKQLKNEAEKMSPEKLIEFKDEVNGKKSKVAVNYFLSKNGKVERIDVEGALGNETLTIMPRKVQKMMRKLSEDEAIKEWQKEEERMRQEKNEREELAKRKMG